MSKQSSISMISSLSASALLLACAVVLAPTDAWARGGRGFGRGAGAGAGTTGQNPNNPANPANPNAPADGPKEAKADPAADRKESEEKFESTLSDGLANKESLTALLEAGSVGSFPAKKATRDQLADKLGSFLDGKTLSKAQAHSLADALATAANPDGLSKQLVSAKQGVVVGVAGALKAAADQKKEIGAAYEKVIDEQVRPAAQKLASDLSLIKDASKVTPQQKQQLAMDLGALVKSSTKPSKASVTALADQLIKDFGGKELTPPDKAQLARDVEAVMNSANVSTDDLKAVFADVEAIAKSSNIDEKDVQTISGDLQAVYQSFPHPKNASASAN